MHIYTYTNNWLESLPLKLLPSYRELSVFKLDDCIPIGSDSQSARFEVRVLDEEQAIEKTLIILGVFLFFAIQRILNQ